MTGVPGVMPVLDDAAVHGGKMHHRHEKRHGRILDKRAFACAIAKSTPDSIRKAEPPHLMFELEWQYCISCNMPHWILTREIQIEELATSHSRYFGWMQKVGYEWKSRCNRRQPLKALTSGREASRWGVVCSSILHLTRKGASNEGHSVDDRGGMENSKKIFRLVSFLHQLWQ